MRAESVVFRASLLRFLAFAVLRIVLESLRVDMDLHCASRYIASFTVAMKSKPCVPILVRCD